MPAGKYPIPGCYVVIPARLGSTRLPQKMLLCETGKSLIEHTYNAAKHARLPVDIIVATDHPSIADDVRAFGGRVMMTSEQCASGTDRVAEVARKLPDARLLVNLQGDEPEMDATAVDRVIQLLTNNPDVPMATLATPLRDRELVNDPGCVKVVCDEQGSALYFSRSAIPFVRDAAEPPVDANPPVYWQHLGIYAYRREFLLEMASWPQSRLEKLEMLEQLRVIERGKEIRVGSVPTASRGIDTPADYQAFVARYRAATTNRRLAA